MSHSTMTSLGRLNAGWGICGFTSTFYAMYNANPATRARLVNATQVYSVLYEICDYLKDLQATNSPHARLVEEFTRSFGVPYDRFTIPDYVAKVEASSEFTRRILQFGPPSGAYQQKLESDELFGVAMPPETVKHYMESVWGWTSTVTEGAGMAQTGKAIVGVRSNKYPELTQYKGLCHYLYRQGGRYYSWGNEYASLQDADDTYEIIYVITIGQRK